jgi:resolvase-like protein
MGTVSEDEDWRTRPCVPHQESDSATIWLPEGFGSAGTRANYVSKQKTDKRCDVIAVWKIDRFGRSLKDLANVLADLDSRGSRGGSFR